MFIHLQSTIDDAQRAGVEAAARELGVRLVALEPGAQLLEILSEGVPVPERGQVVAAFTVLPGVVEVLDRPGDQPLWSSTHRAATIVEVGGAVFGGGRASVIAGPCAVEDGAELLEIARTVQRRGATLLRGGAFKPRSSPYSCQGLGQRGLEHLKDVRESTGLGIVTEVLDPRDIESVLEVADMVQVGARNMANSSLLKELGTVDRPVLLKRGFGATVDEFLSAAEYLLCGGNTRVVLCERGIRSFDQVTRNLLDVGAIAHLREATHLPVIADPSHAAGRSDLVRAIGRAGMAAGADGLMVEVHRDPSAALSDGQQAIGPDEFEALVADAGVLCELDGRTLLTGDHQVPHPSLPKIPTHLRGTA
jgi:3-deoxy-7-phosphoheptulonate synthase